MRIVKRDRVFGLHPGIREIAQRGFDQKDQGFELCHNLLPGDALFGEFLRPVADIAGVGEICADVMVHPADDVQGEVAG